MKLLRTRLFLNATTALTSALGLSMPMLSVADANPLDGNVVSGSAAISTPSPSTVQIDQSSQNAVINWRSFNIESGETTRFVQPNTNSWTLNRVTGDMEPSRILGTLEANGNVAIVNPDGILFGEESRIDVNALIASTHDIANDDFMAGRFRFAQPGNPSASIVNEGQISIGDYGLGAFVAPGVRNSGVITAKMGSLSLASGNAFTLDLYGDNLVHLLVGDEITNEVIDVATGQPVFDLVKNEGRISADGGTVALTSATARRAVNSVINNTGVIEANSVGVRNGKIILGAQTAGTKTAGSPIQRVKVSGTLSATNVPLPTTDVPLPTRRPDGDGIGGTIEITGEMIEIAAADVDVSGKGGGGKVLIGGDYLGGKASDETMAAIGIEREAQAIPTASYVSLDSATTINADAIQYGDGGKVVVWSDIATVTGAKITARGGAKAGDGGFIETSGRYLDAQRAADASAPNGQAGTWLLDPLDMAIRDVAANTNVFSQNVLIGGTIPGIQHIPTGSPSVVDTNVIEASLNTGTNVQVTNRGIVAGSGTGNITIEDDINKTAGGDAQLFINAYNDILVSSGVDITSSSGALSIYLVTTDGGIIGNNVGTIDTNGGVLSLEARDGISFHSTQDMPDYLYLLTNPLGTSPDPFVLVDVSFDDDQVTFVHDNTTAVILPGGARLVDATATGEVAIDFRGLNVALADNAVLVEGDRAWSAFIDSDRTIGARNDNALNKIPEIVSDGSVSLAFRNFEVGGITPVVEVDATNADNCFGLSCIATGPSGAGLIAAHVAPTPPVARPEVPANVDHPEKSLEQFVDAVYFGPVQAESVLGRTYTPEELRWHRIYQKVISDRIVANIVAYVEGPSLSLVDYYLIKDLPKSASDLPAIAFIENLLTYIGRKNEVALTTFKVMNLGRNAEQDPWVSYDEVTSGLPWELVPDAEKAFHVTARDPDQTEKYVNSVTGREYVFDVGGSTATLVSDGINDGTYNFVTNAESVRGHVILDVLPWIVWGAGPNDTTTQSARLKLVLDGGVSMVGSKKDDFVNKIMIEIISLSSVSIEVAGGGGSW